MTEPQSYLSSTADGGAALASSEPRPPATPRWVKVSGLVLALIALAVLAKLAVGGGMGGHGPGMHTGSGGTGVSTGAALQTSPASTG